MPKSTSNRTQVGTKADTTIARADGAGFLSPEALEAIVEVMSRHDVVELDQVRGEGASRVRLTIRRKGHAIAAAAPAPAAHAFVPPTPVLAHAPAPVASTPAAAPASGGAPANDEGAVYVTSPLVGTFYRAPGPDASPFVDVGSEIRPGQRLCIVEAMKLMNEIESEIEGTILEVLVDNGKPVEYGQRLFRVKKK